MRDKLTGKFCESIIGYQDLISFGNFDNEAVIEVIDCSVEAEIEEVISEEIPDVFRVALAVVEDCLHKAFINHFR